MRRSKIFIGGSHPELGELICNRLGVPPAPCNLRKFSNGETGIEIGVSVRDEDVYIVQSGSSNINDHVMELLILISGCKSGSANKITAVIPSYPYSKQSKMKKHRGAITARMLANLLTMAGADHIITMDLHAQQMQGFFTKPVDNLYAGPTLARWIKLNIQDHENAVIVSKNPGGTKRVTALADALKLNFAMIHTDRKRKKYKPSSQGSSTSTSVTPQEKKGTKSEIIGKNPGPSPLSNHFNSSNYESESTVDYEFNEDQIVTVQGLQTARIVQGHVVDDAYPEDNEDDELLDDAASINDPMSQSTYSIASQPELHHALGGSVDAAGSDDEGDFYVQQEKLITLVGDVRDKTAIIIDDMIDGANSFIAAAEHCRINCGAKKVYVVATHGIFNSDSLEKLEESKCVDAIVVTNTYPIPADKMANSKKLTVIDISPILAECIRRNHHGESISALFEHLSVI
ncbi:ribose-phosphate pyrophosphokinase [Nadsonia fulvescens var. elongata DSM 6958]|uniref:Ribose-phosphate pyrophosphokinase 1 n=1 Tax=Nadsonia fulvescens var. elongata DSM 6958 TaxID=857566 RepID=A0A1E3PEG9_9ASCO|nr:ribose-phosphate pyrophosphokinase [Nadsonia fulvescens var. elongata DSM 6958]